MERGRRGQDSGRQEGRGGKKEENQDTLLPKPIIP